MKRFVEIGNGLYPLTISAKAPSSMFDWVLIAPSEYLMIPLDNYY